MPDDKIIVESISTSASISAILGERFTQSETSFAEYIHARFSGLLLGKAPLQCKLILDGNVEPEGVVGLDVILLKKKLNNYRRINVILKTIHDQLLPDGAFFGKAETLEERQARIFGEKPLIPRSLSRFYDFIFKRVLTDLPLLGPTYRKIVRIKNRPLSRCDILGRLYYCGFSVEDEYEDGQYLFFKAVKNRKTTETPVSKALVFKQPRVGKQGKTIYCYKFRTMYPYAPYIHEYIVKTNNLAEGGKVHKDFRITTWGRFFRRYWLDELPMILNLINGDLKIVGVRPLSRTYFNMYPDDIRQLRIKTKPGLLPPYYADMPSTFAEIIASEKRYLDSYLRHSWLTDIRYFIKIVYNILQGARSR